MRSAIRSTASLARTAAARNFMSTPVVAEKLTAPGLYDSMRAHNIDGFYGELVCAVWV